MINYTQYGLENPSKIKSLHEIRNAWDNLLVNQSKLPPKIVESYSRKIVGIANKLNYPTFWRKHPEKEYQYPINAHQARQISEIVEDNVQAYLYEVMGMELPSKRVKELIKKNILSKKVIRRDFPRDIYMFGRTVTLLEQGLDFYDAKRMASRNPLSGIERTTIEHLRQSAAEQVTGLANGLTGKIKNIISTKNQDFIRRMIAEGKERKLTNSEIKSAIGHATGDWARDLFRIVYTEGHSYQQLAVALDIQQKFGTNPTNGQPMRVMVAKQPEPDACQYCFKLYTNPDGSLKMFYLDDLMSNPLMNTPYYENGRIVTRSPKNIGNDKIGWLPVIGATHPYCRCRLVKYYPHLHDRKYIENEIKSGMSNKNALTSVNKWQQGFKESKER